MQQYHKCICCSPVKWNIRIKVSGYHIADIQVSKADCNLKHIYIKQQIWSFLIYRKAFIRKKMNFFWIEWNVSLIFRTLPGAMVWHFLETNLINFQNYAENCHLLWKIPFQSVNLRKEKKKIIFSFSLQIAFCISVAWAAVSFTCVFSLVLYDYGINSESLQKKDTDWTKPIVLFLWRWP